ELPAEAGEPARRIDVDSPEAYAKEYGAETTFMDPTSDTYKWVLNDLDRYYRERRSEQQGGNEDAGRTCAAVGGHGDAPAQKRTALGTASDVGVPHTASEAQAEATSEIRRLRSRVYDWRRSAPADVATARVIDDYLAQLRDLAERNRKGENVEGALAGIREHLPVERRLAKPIGREQVLALQARIERQLAGATDDKVKAELTSLLAEAKQLAGKTKANPNFDARTAYDSISRGALRAGREDYEVYVPLTDPVTRARVTAWFEQHLAPLSADPVGEILLHRILAHLDTADALTLQQSPRAAGDDVAGTSAMRKQVLQGITAHRYPPEYTALFEAAARGRADGWPRDQAGAWEVDHVAELWLGGADDITNYMALPPAVHKLKTEILGAFRAQYRSGATQGEQTDIRTSTSEGDRH
ncbi:MAG TPA: hypothetical protein VFN61_03545, partial [Acidimicrobiales bacterium]|nr:hypothetical protein [Acidimicrobiales bacterium]